MKVCIIGATGHTGYVLSGLQGQGDVRLAAVAPGSPGEDMDGLLRSAAAAGHAPEVFASYTDMLDRVRPEIAAVACHFNDHAAVAAQALKRGIHVFGEKPLATTLEDLTRVRSAHAESGAHLAAMLGIRYTAPFLTVKQLIQEGIIGEIRLMQAQKSYKLGNRSELYRKRETFGGTIPWVGSHAIDWLHWLSGERFLSVYAAHSKRGNRGHDELEATGLCQFTLTNEVFGSVSIDYLRPNQAKGHADDRIRIVGTQGVLEVRDHRVHVTDEATGRAWEAPLLPERESFADFLRQARGEGTCLVTAEESFLVTEACLKARQSADEGCVVSF